MRRLITILAAVVALSCLHSCTKASDYGYVIKDGKAIYNTPPRPADQQSMLGFAAEPIENIRVGFIGLGMRGPDAVMRFTFLENTTTIALCDLLQENLDKCKTKLAERCDTSGIACYVGEEAWREVCERDDIDLIYLAVPWQLHTKMAVYAMECGKHVAVEVPAATSIEECWALVNTSERTRKHCIMLENCIYDDFELTTLNMAQHGLFGDVIHVEGAYIHNLDPFWERYQGDWRMSYNKEHRGDVYPTHGIGPVAEVLGIHRGDRMEYLVSMDTDSFHGKELGLKKYGDSDYANGDHTGTFIRTAKGKTIQIQHDTYNPRPYSRAYQLTGTMGFANKYPTQGYSFASLEGLEVLEIDNLNAEKLISEEQRKALMEEYQHPITKENGLLQKAKEVGGHGGMDFIMDYRLVYCLHNGLPLDQDVYDAAEWSCIIELSEVSINNGSIPVVMPDFTRGEWNKLDGVRFAMK